MNKPDAGKLAVDLDGTLAHKQEPFNPYTVGDPHPKVMKALKAELANGRKVVIFTARASSKDKKMHQTVRDWLIDHDLGDLKVTSLKTPDLQEFWDDKAVQVIPETGEFVEKKAGEPGRSNVSGFLQTLQKRRGHPGLPLTPYPQIPTNLQTALTPGPAGAKITSTLTPAAAIAPAYGDKWQQSLASAQSYQKANPQLPFTNDVSDARMQRQVPVEVSDMGVGSIVAGTSSPSGWGEIKHRLFGGANYPDGLVRVNTNPVTGGHASDTLRHEMRHTTQINPENGYTSSNWDKYVSSPAEVGARLPELNAAWVRRGGEFPKTPEDAMRILQHYTTPWYESETVPPEQFYNNGPTPVREYKELEQMRLNDDGASIRGMLRGVRSDEERAKLMERLSRIMPGLVDANALDTVKAAAYLVEAGMKESPLVIDADLDLPDHEVFQMAVARAEALGLSPTPEVFTRIQTDFETAKARRQTAKKAYTTAEKLHRMWIRKGHCPACGGSPKDFDFLDNGGSATCNECNQPFVPGEEKAASEHHCTKNLCPECNGTSTCRCSKPKTITTHEVCWNCTMKQTKEAKAIVRKTRIVEEIDDHCPHCDYKFREKGGPIPSDYDAARENRTGDYDMLCPSCHGIVDEPDMTDEEIDRPIFGYHNPSISQRLRDRRAAKQRRRLSRESSLDKNVQGGEVKEASAAPTRKAVIITGNPKYIEGNPKAEEMYGGLESVLQSLGYSTTRDPGNDHTSPPPAHLWVGHSRGMGRLRWAPEGVRTVRVDDFLDADHLDPTGEPTDKHYTITDQLLQAIMEQDEASKTASSTTFHQPENHECLESLGTTQLHGGMMDWEESLTTLWAEHTHEGQQTRCWLDVKYPDDLDPGELQRTDVARAKAHGKAAVKAWVAAARLIAKENHGAFPSVQDFQEALEAEAMKPFVLACSKAVDTERVKRASVGPITPLTGPMAIKRALENLDLKALRAQAEADIKSGKVTRRDRGVKMLHAITGLERNEMKPSELMITRVPVLPPQFRPFAMMGTTYIPGDANELYQDLFKHRELHQQTLRTLGPDGAPLTRRNLLNSVRALYGYGDPVSPKLQERGTQGYLQRILGGSPKTSYFQRRVISKTQDSVGRGTITVDPELGLDEISLPRDMAWDLFGSHVQRAMVQGGVSRADAIRAVKDRSSHADQTLQGVIRKIPVMYSRAPAWHKFSSIGGFAKIHDGDNVAISPFVTAGLNADFDGDQCVNQILACIPCKTIPVWRMSYPKLSDHRVRFPQGVSSIPMLEDSQLFIFDLEDFPHGDLIQTKDGKNGRIDFHQVDKLIHVLAYDEKTRSLQWVAVAGWSKHYAREIEIVDTHNGYQIITDDDPRAVYGTAAGKLEMCRFTPAEAERKKVLIPRARYVPAPEETVTSVPGCKVCTHHRTTLMPDVIQLGVEVGWLLGAMCGDGWVIKSKESIKGFALADNDGWNVKRLRQVLSFITRDGSIPSEHAVAYTKNEPGRYGDTIAYRYQGWNLGAWFRSLIGGERDETTAGSANKHLPPFYLSTPREFRSALLCGLLDTDGSISVSGGKKKPQLMAAFGSTSIRLVMECKLLAASLGIFGRITPSETPLGKPCWQLSFSTQQFQDWGAPYMVHGDKLAKLRSVPVIEDSQVTAKYDIIPVSAELADALAKKIGCPKIRKAERAGADTGNLRERMDTQKLYMSFAQARNSRHEKYGAVSRQTGQAALDRLGDEVIAKLPGGMAWLQVVRDEGVTWERVTGIQKTGIREDGYDLTVPGYETFMSADGIILSNTINVHSPMQDETIQEVKDRLMPSKMLFSIRDQDQVMPQPKHEMILGLNSASTRPAKQVHQFASRELALAAMDRGDVSWSDEIDLPDPPPTL